MAKITVSHTKKGLLQSAGKTTCIPWHLLAVLSLVSLALLVMAVVRPFSPAVYMYFYRVCTICYPLVLAFLCIKGSPGIIDFLHSLRIASCPGRRFIPLLLGLNMLFFIFAQIAFLLCLLIVHVEAPFPSLPYYLIFGIYPCLIVAILLLPEHGVSSLARLRIFLDSLIIIVAVATLCSYFVLAPILMQGNGTLAEKIVGVLYPSSDLVILFCLLLVALRSGEPSLRPVLIMLGLGLSFIFLVHISRLYEVLNDTFRWVGPLSVAWAFTVMMIVGAAQTVKNMLKRDEVAGYAGDAAREAVGMPLSASRWKPWLSLSLVLVASLLIFLLWLAGVEKIFQGEIAIIYIGGFIVLMLIVLRQLLMMYEISVLQRKLQKRNRGLALLNDLLAKQATIDSLTGLPNHRELMTRLDAVLANAQETTSTCAIIFMDLDHFKAINDRYGHIIGDAVLCEFSGLVLSCMRVNDYLGRWGGEEFVAVLPGVERAEARQAAERMRVIVEQHVFADEQEIHLTCSSGVATYPYVATLREELLMNADRAMYTAKRLGRNQVRAASEPLVLAMGMLAEAPETAEQAEMLAVVESLIAALEARDHPTGQHSRRVAALSFKLALAFGLNWSDACSVGMGGLLHDLGKVAMPDAILFKRGKLSAAEIEYMARHPLVGEKILARLPSLRAVAVIVRTHHEWIDGSGYPDGLRDGAIPLGARIVAVADAYDAIISHRVYRQGRASAEAVNELRKGAGRQFDPRVVEALDCLLAASPRLSATSAA